jgi:anti-sigma factor RsiW
MSSCLTDATLQAYLDGELRDAAHLRDCDACAGRLDLLRSRAARVYALLDALEEPVPLSAVPVLRSRRRVWPTAVAGTLAASILLAIALPRHPTVAPAVDYFMPLGDTGEPIQIGTVVQVSLPASLFDDTGSVPASQRIQAELILGDDGRARAIRFLQ